MTHTAPAPARAAALTTEAAFDLLAAVASGQRRCTLATLTKAAAALPAIRAHISHAPSTGYHVLHDGYFDACGTLADVADLLLRLLARAPYAAAPAPELTALPLTRRIQAAAAAPLLPGEAVAPAPAPAPAAPAPELPAFVTYSQQQQQPQQGKEWRSPARGGRVAWDEPGESAAVLAALPVLPPADKYSAPCPPKAPAPTCLVNAGPRARSTAPSHLPPEGARLLDRFELVFDSVLTVGTSNTKIGKGQAIAHSAGFFGLPAKQLSTAIYGALDAPVAARGRLEAVRRLALENDLGAAAQRLDACPWASDGCRDGCLVFSGRNAMGTAPAACKARRSLARLWAPNVFSVVLLWAIAREYARAQRMGLPLSLRLKGTDDLPHHLQTFNLHNDEVAILQRRYGLPVIGGYGVTLPEVLSLALQDGSIRWYEYSKAPLGGSQGLLDLRDCGIDVTASLAADRRDGARAACGAIRAGFRLAVPLDIPRGAALPAELLLAPTLGLPAPADSPEFGRVPADDRPVRLLCIDGDKTDLRWLDPQGPQPGGYDGVAVMLRTKRSRGRGAAAAAFSLQPSAEWQALKGGGFARLTP